jgi:hypothetical protein
MIILLLFLTFSLLAPKAKASVQMATSVVSQWLVNPVKLDGKITSVSEWSDTVSYDLTLVRIYGWPNRRIGPETLTARFWFKNDATWLYLLVRVAWPASDIDVYDGAFIELFWGQYGPPWEHSDFSFVTFGGLKWDAYGWDESRWYGDTDASPPGQNNVEGAGSYDGTYYWFEFRKTLNSGDGRDWSLASGQIVGSPNAPAETPHLIVGIWDNSISSSYECYISLTLSTQPPIGNLAKETISRVIPAMDLDGDGNPDPWTSRYDISFVNQILRIEIKIQLKGDDPGDALRRQWEDGIENIWSNRYDIIDGVYTYPIMVDVNWVNRDAHHVVTVHSGRGRSNMLNWYTETDWGPEFQGRIAAHEAGHMLGLYDEYAEPFTDTNNNGRYDPGEPFTDNNPPNGKWDCGALNPDTWFITTNSIMADLGPARRWHYEQILRWLETRSGRDLDLAQSPLPPYQYDTLLSDFSDPQPPSIIESSDHLGNPKDTFVPNETVYVTVQESGSTVTLYVVADQTSWNDGDPLIDVSDGPETLTLKTGPGTQTVQIWVPTLKTGNYDIVMDVDNDGVFDAKLDLVDSFLVAGFTVKKVTEFNLSIILMTSILLFGWLLVKLNIKKRNKNTIR